MQNINTSQYELFEGNNIVSTTETNFPLYENESTPALLTTFQQTSHAIPQPNNILDTLQKTYSSIKALKKSAKRQLEQADELKDQLNQLKQLIIMQQQQSLPRRINRTRVHRPHPYLYSPLVSSCTRPSVSTAPADYHNHDNGFMAGQNILSNSSHPQQAPGVPVAATGGFPDGDEIFSASSQNSEFFNTTYETL